MHPSPSLPDTIDRIDRGIAEAERLIHEEVKCLISDLQKGDDTTESEAHVQQLRAALELSQAQRQKLVRSMHDPQPSSATVA
jgi:hypothetical protein